MSYRRRFDDIGYRADKPADVMYGRCIYSKLDDAGLPADVMNPRPRFDEVLYILSKNQPTSCTSKILVADLTMLICHPTS